MLDLINLKKNYGRHEVLKDINLHFPKGEVAGIAGSNGAGKTTLFRCICGLEAPDSGQVIYQGKDLKDVLGFLPTTPWFFSKMTAKEYLHLLCNARNVIHPDFDAFNVFELPLGAYAENFSTGMKKKLALTGLLLQGNEVFVLDEPFNGVDLQGNFLMNDLIRKLKNLHKIVLLSSHIFSTLRDNCDVLYHLKDGQIQVQYRKDSFDLIEKELLVHEGGHKIDQLKLR